MLPSLFLPDTLDAALRLGSAVAIGGMVGLDRGLRNKPAGLRTHALVSLGAALMTYTGIELAPTEPSAITRVLQGVIVEVTSPQLIEKVRSTTTDQNGRYQIVRLPVVRRRDR